MIVTGFLGYVPIMLNQEKEKPPTQGVGVQGFKADVYACDEEKILWQELVHIPKFQRFALEVSLGKYGHVGNVMEWIVGFVQDSIRSDGEKEFFNSYVTWHDAKGYWKNETVYGELI